MQQTRTMPKRARRAAMLLAALLFLGGALSGAQARSDDSRHERDRGGYVFATTRGLSETDMHPALRVTILPVAVVLDLIFLPFALIADTMAN